MQGGGERKRDWGRDLEAQRAARSFSVALLANSVLCSPFPSCAGEGCVCSCSASSQLAYPSKGGRLAQALCLHSLLMAEGGCPAGSGKLAQGLEHQFLSSESIKKTLLKTIHSADFLQDLGPHVAAQTKTFGCPVPICSELCK